MKILNAWICQVVGDKVIPKFGDLEVRDGYIHKIDQKKYDFSSFEQETDDQTINAQGRVLTIPNVNFHDHIYSRLAKGLNIKGDMSDFTNILKNLWWKLDSLLDMDMIKASAKMAAIESIKNGVTYIIDHHSSPNSADGSLSAIASELESFYIRNILCFETTDRNGSELKQKGLTENINYLLNYSSQNSKSLFGLHASFTLNDDTIEKAAQIANKYNCGIHVHLCEDISDNQISLNKYSKRPMQRFNYYDLLNDKSILAHGIHLNEDDFKLISESKAALVFNLDSNMNNAVGLQNFKNIPLDIPILVGTDGMHSNVARSFKELFLQIRNAGLSFDKSFEFIQKSYFDQIHFITKFFPDFTNLNVGERADYIIWDYVPPTTFDLNNFWGHYIYGILESQINTVVQHGKVLLSDKKITDMDEVNIKSEIFIQGERLFNYFNKD